MEPSPHQVQSQLLVRLMALRAAMRRRLLAYGACAVASGGVYALLTILALDWLAHLPGLLRLCVGALFVVGFAGAALHWVVRPLRAVISVRDLARQIECHYTHLDDRLSSTVSFLQGDEVGSAALRRRVIENTDLVMQKLPIYRILTLRPLVSAIAFLLASAALLAAITTAAPNWIHIGTSRYLDPFGRVSWPTAVEIVPLTGERKVAFGESVEVRMQAIRGGTHTLRGVVRLRSDDGDVATLAMHRGENDVYTCKIDQVTRPLLYWFEAGDDSTEPLATAIRVVHRPVVLTCLGKLRPPPYAEPREPVDVDLASGALRATQGSTLELEVRVSKPVRTDDAGHAEAELLVGQSQHVPLSIVEGDLRRLRGALPLAESCSAAVKITDVDGFDSQGGPAFQLVVVADQPPSVRVVEPRATVEVTPVSTLPVTVQASDDLGVAALRLAAESSSGGKHFDVPLNDQMEHSESQGRSTAQVRYLWDLSQLSASPGDTILFRAIAQDNFTQGERHGQSTSSPTLRVKIISRDDFQRRLRARFAQLEARIRQALVDQEMLAERSEHIAARMSDESGAASSGADLATAETAQTRLVTNLDELADRFSELQKSMAEDGSVDDHWIARVKSIAFGLTETAAGSMSDAVHQLDVAGGLVSSGRRRSLLDFARKSQLAAAQELRRILRVLGEWGDFQEMVARTQDMLDRQQAIRAQTVRQGELTLGRAADQLPAQTRQTLQRNALNQRRLAEEAETLVEQMRKLAAAAATSDAASASALDDTARAAAAAEIIRNMRDAAGAIDDNRTAAAQIGQRAAETGLSEMLAALRERQQRKLEHLAKAIQSARAAVARLLEQQRELIAATQEARGQAAVSAVFDRLAQQQDRLAGNTRHLAGEWSDDEDMLPVAQALAQCGPPMANATVQLFAGEGSLALDDQHDAESLLVEALAELERLAADTRHQAERQRIAAAQAKLRAVQSRQIDVNSETDALVKQLSDGQRLGRLGARKAASLARQQGDLATQVDELHGELDDAVVYAFVLRRARTGMQTSTDALQQRALDAELRETQDRVADELELLVSALNDLYNLPSPDEFERGGGGGGGAAAKGGQLAPVPTLAELLVLKAMQQSLMDRTQRAADKTDPVSPTETDLQRIRTLAAEQQEIRDLTEQIIERSAANAP